MRLARRPQNWGPVEIPQNWDWHRLHLKKVKPALMRFLVVDDHRLVAQVLASLLSEFCALELIGICPSVQQAKTLLSMQRADLLILDLQLPGESWEDAADLFLGANPDGAIVVLSALTSGFVLPQRFRGSVLAVIDKSDAWHALVDCVVAWRIKQGPRLHATSLPAAQLAALNAREKTLLAALGRGCLNREIAAELGLSLATVETYRKGIASKLGVSGKQLVRLAVLLRLQP